ncbi:motility protein A [Clostridiisalibacter paucivorans]|uniref:motility protein A n=1 Tax=Clostridiisalibacter paucivorans TaxID=408753 RepID=UPI000B03BB73|nr:motility-associated protein [Clostridiisalibacter paucivorans]
MDLGTGIGFFAGIGFIVWGIMLSGSLGTFMDTASIFIVLGGTIAATLISFPLKNVLNTFKVVKNVFTEKDSKADELIKEIIDLANIARKEGLLALEEAVNNTENTFL